MRSLLTSLLSLFVCLPPLFPRSEQRGCGTHALQLQEELSLHRKLSAAKRAGTKRLAERSAPRPDVGNIAILDDSDGVVARRNDFDLQNRTLSFLPTGADARRYRVQLGEASYDAAAADRGERVRGLGDDDTRQLSLPFAFPYFGGSYRELFVNSDGNLSFTAGDGSTADRSLGRFAAGVPRIGALFGDLDPSRAVVGITVVSDPSRFVVTWNQVPEYADFGRGPLQTFQVRLYPGGRIELAYQTVSAREAVVGITPGRLQGAATVVSFSDGPAGEYDATVAERFTSLNEIDTVTASQRFYLNHDDAYDYLVFFNGLSVEASGTALAFQVSVRNRSRGIGDPIVDIGGEYGSPRRLQAVLNMGPLTNYPADPNAVVPLRLSAGDTPLSVLAHEAGHLFSSYVSVREPDNPRARPMLGRGAVHWAFTYQTDASVMGGNRIRDNGPNASPRFETVEASQRYSPLDQYLMGVREPFEVPDTFLVQNASVAAVREPEAGVRFDGTRRDVTIQEIIAAEGRRVPDSTVSQRRFRFAFVLIVGRDAQPTAEQVTHMEGYRRQFEGYFARIADSRVAGDTRLQRAVQVSVAPAAGVVEGRSAAVTISLASPAAAPLPLLLSTQSGAVRVPGSVTVPAGATAASVSIEGLRAGVDELLVRPSDERYETAVARLQVRPVSGVTLSVVSGNDQVATPGQTLASPVVIRATDANLLPYPNVRIRVTVSGGGAVDAQEVVTDASGLARIRWTPGASSSNELALVREGADPSAALVVRAVSRPVLAQGAVVNSASFAPGLTPGGLATLFGASLRAAADDPAFQVLVNGTPVPVLYADARQVNVLVPADASPGAAEVVVVTSAGRSTPVPVVVSAAQPGLFADPASGFGAVVTYPTGQLNAVVPVQRGGILQVYGTGLGPTRFTDAGLQATTLPVRVTIGDAPAEVLFSGLAPGFPGLYQVNARVPEGVAVGTVLLRVAVGDAVSNVVVVRVAERAP